MRCVTYMEHRYEESIVFVAAVSALMTLSAPAFAASKPYQKYLNGDCGLKVCKINFDPVPAGSRLDIQNVSCYMRLARESGTGNVTIHAAQLLVIRPERNNPERGHTGPDTHRIKLDYQHLRGKSHGIYVCRRQASFSSVCRNFKRCL